MAGLLLKCIAHLCQHCVLVFVVVDLIDGYDGGFSVFNVLQCVFEIDTRVQTGDFIDEGMTWIALLMIDMIDMIASFWRSAIDFA